MVFFIRGDALLYKRRWFIVSEEMLYLSEEIVYFIRGDGILRHYAPLLLLSHLCSQVHS